ncbi:MAG TPA: hypothetical protein VEJ19_00160 [Nitrososphaerales archaeon]|nr:hypothetical protein [Nitrososphaerales archaeon]
MSGSNYVTSYPGWSAISIALFALAFLSGYTNQNSLEIFFIFFGLIAFFVYLGFCVGAYLRTRT